MTAALWCRAAPTSSTSSQRRPMAVPSAPSNRSLSSDRPIESRQRNSVRKSTKMQIAGLNRTQKSAAYGTPIQGAPPSRTRRTVAELFAWAMTALAACALFAVAGCGGGGGGGGASATVSGTVLEISPGAGAAAVSGATVSIGGASTTTLADGSWSIPSASASATQLKVSGSGLQALTQPLPKLKAGQT